MRLKVAGGLVLMAVFSLVVAGLAVAVSSGVADAATFYCQGEKATIVGTAKADVLIGTSGADVIVGLGGADKIKGRGGADLICAGAGPDTVWGQGGRDKIYLGAGNDVAYGGPGNDRIYGGDGKDVLYGDEGVDRLNGEKGKDRLNGGPGGDILRGNNGSDTLVGQAGPDVLVGHAGADYLTGGGGIDSATGGTGLDSCFAESVSGCEPTVLATSFTSILNSYCWDDSVNISGKVYADSLQCRGYSVGNVDVVEYDLGRNYLTFKSVVGIDDYSTYAESTYRMRVYGDDVLLKSVDVGYGESKLLVADVKDVLRLKIEATRITGGSGYNYPSWGTALVSANRNTSVPAPAAVIPLNSARLGLDIGSVRSAGCSWFIDPAQVNGVIYSNSVQCRIYSVGTVGWLDYVLSRSYGTLTTTVGQRDDSAQTGDTYRFSFFADDVLKKVVDVPFGASVPVTLNLDGVLRLRVQALKMTGATGYSRPVFGEPVLTP